MSAGIDWANMQLRIFTCGRVRCESGWSMGPEWWERLRDFDLWFVWAGKGRMSTSDGEVELLPGTCVWMRPGRRYEATQDESDRLGVSYLHFMLYNDAHRSISPSATQPPEVHRVSDLAYFDAMTRRIIELTQRARLRGRVGESPDHVPEILLLALLRDFAAEAMDRKSGEPRSGIADRHRDVILRQVARIYESPASVPGIRALARECGYGPDHFSRIFKAVTGMGPQALMIQARIERARQLLSESSLSIGEIANALGYHDPFHFSRQFKEKAGCSPREFRRRGGLQKFR